MCKIVFSKLTLILGAQKNRLIEKTLFSTSCMSEMTREQLIYALYIPLNIKKRARVGPPTKCNLNGVLLADLYWSDIV